MVSDALAIPGGQAVARKVWAYQCDQEDDAHMETLPLLPRTGARIKATYKEDRQELFKQVLEADEVRTGPFVFVEAFWFQSLVGVVIFANAILLGLETDIMSPYWVVIEQCILIFFVYELSVRVRHFGGHFFGTFGNLFDVLIVMAGVVDMWFMPVAELVTTGRQQHRRSALVSAIQMLRLLRIVRLVRLVKIIQPLYRLTMGIAEALQGMFWVLVFLSMMLYAGAILCTRLLGHSELMEDEPEESAPPAYARQSAAAAAGDAQGAEAIQGMFHSVFSSMFVLFEMMSCWSLMKFRPLFRRLPLIRLLAVLFYIFSAWALLAVMTGVVSEKMIAVKEQLTHEELDREQARSTSAAAKIRALFAKVDMDNSGTISKEEFNAMLLYTDIAQELMLLASVNAQDLGELFDWLDHDKDGTVDVGEFLAGFRWLTEQISPKSLLKLEADISADIKKLERHLVDSTNARFDCLISSVSQPLRKIHAITEQIQRLDMGVMASQGLTLFRQTSVDRLTSADLAAAERRMSERIDRLAEAVETLDKLQAAGKVRLRS